MQNTLTNFNTNQFIPYTVGFDSLFEKLFDLDTSSNGFPPYNIMKTNKNNYIIEMALAGYSQKDIQIETYDGELVIKSIKKDKDTSAKVEIVHKGISQRNFIKKFTLSDEVLVKDAEMQNGMLYINLERVLPEHKKTKLIKIN